MRARCTTMQEMKTYKCEEPGCPFAPTYQLLGTDSNGLPATKYFCNDHYNDFVHTAVQENTKEYCDLCGNSDTSFSMIPKFVDANPGKLYKACPGCVQEQEDLAREEFEETEDHDDEDDRKNLDDTPYENF
jgi:hypothetical protein